MDPSAPYPLPAQAPPPAAPSPAAASIAWRRPAAHATYSALAWAFVAAVVVQVFLAGLSVTSDSSFWPVHGAFAPVLELLALLLAAVAAWGKAPRRFLGLPLGAFGLIWLQYVLINLPSGWVRAAHPVNALLIFTVGLAMALHARRAGRAAAVALLLVMVALSGCLADSSAPSAPETPERDAEGRYVIHVGQDGNTFTPRNAQVPAGATVVWVNHGGHHDVTAVNGSFTSGDPKDGEWTVEHTFPTAGVFDYFCSPHKVLRMTGTVTVVAAEEGAA